MIDLNNNIIYQTNKKKFIFISIIVIIIVLTILASAMQLLKYHEEGEKNLPFELKDMLIVSTADGIGKENSENRWDLSILQNNDIYIEFKDKVDNKRNDPLKKITIDNFNISNGPIKGEPKLYHPVNDKDLIFVYKDENLVTDNKIEYNVAAINNVKKQEFARDGGIIAFSSCSGDVANYVSNEDNEIKYDGSLLTKVNITQYELKYNLSFDITVEMESNKKYKATINLELPLENFITEGTSQKEITDFSNVEFKRV